MWCVVLQLLSGLQAIHAYGLSCRVVDARHVLETERNRYRLGSGGGMAGLAPRSDPGALPLVPPIASAAPAAAAAAVSPLPWYARLTPWHAAAAVWAVGVAVLAVHGVVGYIRLKRRVALACKTPDGYYSGA